MELPLQCFALCVWSTYLHDWLQECHGVCPRTFSLHAFQCYTTSFNQNSSRSFSLNRSKYLRSPRYSKFILSDRHLCRRSTPVSLRLVLTTHFAALRVFEWRGDHWMTSWLRKRLCTRYLLPFPLPNKDPVCLLIRSGRSGIVNVRGAIAMSLKGMIAPCAAAQIQE